MVWVWGSMGSNHGADGLGVGFDRFGFGVRMV